MQADYGNPTTEYLDLRSGRGYVTGFSEVIWVTGSDAVSFLDSQVSQDVAAMAPGTTSRSFLLEPRGKLISLMWLLRGTDRVGCVVEQGRGVGIIEHLERFRFRVEVDMVLDERRVAEVWGANLTEIGTRAGLSAQSDWKDGDDVLVAMLRGKVLNRLLVVGSDDAALEALGVRAAGRMAADAVRVEAGEPLMGVDIDEATIAQESGLVDEAVSFTKGCYVGQELVARIDSRGRVNRRLVGVTMSQSPTPPVGSEVLAGDAVVGTLSTVGHSLALGSPVALAMVRREVAPGDPVTVRWEAGSVAARVNLLPLHDLADFSQNSYNEDQD